MSFTNVVEFSKLSSNGYKEQGKGNQCSTYEINLKKKQKTGRKWMILKETVRLLPLFPALQWEPSFINSRMPRKFGQMN